MIQIQDKYLDIPLIQGGMGVGVSLSSLAGHVAMCGGMGVISAAHPGYLYEGFRQNPIATNCQAIKDHIKRAKEIAQGHGLIGVNIRVMKILLKLLLMEDVMRLFRGLDFR